MADTSKADINNLYGNASVETFLNVPKCDDLDTLDADIAIIAAPCATPYSSVGAYCREAPAAIRKAIGAYAETAHHYDFDLGGPFLHDGSRKVVDCGDLDYDEADAAGNRDRIREAVGKIVGHGAVPVVIGGDDSIPIPVFEALAGRGPFTILQIDAHIDWRQEVQGETLGLSSTMRRASEMDHIERIIQCGQRAVGSARPGDYQDAVDWGVEFVLAREIHRHGIQPIVDLIPEGSNVLISLDCDALDPTVIPGVLARAPGGMTYWQTIDLIDATFEKANVSGFNIIELVPEVDIDGMGALTAGRIIANVVGRLCRHEA